MSSPLYPLWAARHAPTDAAGRCFGRFPVAVTVSATVAADQLIGSYSFAELPTVVWTSPAPRCYELACTLASRWGAEVRCEESLWELSYGDWEGKRWDVIEAEHKDVWNHWMSSWRSVAPPGGETVAALEMRVRNWFCSLERSVPQMLLAHAGVLRALQVITQGLSWEEAMGRPVPHLHWMSFHG
jgi:alpha-ribazole phosphatase